MHGTWPPDEVKEVGRRSNVSPALRTALLVGGWTACLLAFVVVCIRVLHDAVGLDQPGPWPVFGFVDYRDTIYGPVFDILAGHNPYDVHAYLSRYPTRQPFNLYLPQHFVLFGWLAFLPLPLAIVVMAGLSTAATAWLVREGLRLARVSMIWLPWVLAGLIVRGPLLMCIRQGQIAMILAAASWLAIYGKKPRMQVLGVCVALVKPQVGLPLLFVLLVLGKWRPAVLGLLTAAVLSIPVTIIASIAAGGPLQLIKSMLENVSTSTQSDAFLIGPLDISGIAKAAGLVTSDAGSTALMFATAMVCALSMLFLRRRGAQTSLECVWIATLSLVVIVPSLRYSDGALIPATVCALIGPLARRSTHIPWPLLASAALVVLSVVRSETVEKALGAPTLVTTQASGWCILAALLLVLCRTALALRCPSVPLTPLPLQDHPANDLHRTAKGDGAS